MSLEEPIPVITQPWKCILCKVEGEIQFHTRPKTPNEFIEIGNQLRASHLEKSPNCKANVISEERAMVGGSILSYLVLTNPVSTPEPSAAQLLARMPVREQLMIVKSAVDRISDENTRRLMKDLVLIEEQNNIRLEKIEKFIISLTNPGRIRQ